MLDIPAVSALILGWLIAIAVLAIVYAFWRSQVVGWPLYALVWAVGVAAGVYTAVLLAVFALNAYQLGAWGGWLLYVLDPIPDGEAMLIGFWTGTAAIVIWLIVLWRRVPARWALIMVGAALVTRVLLLSYPAYLIFAAFAAIASGKFLIGAVGRWSVFGNSKLRPGPAQARPRGLVEYESCEDI